jgi:hypothetical protein
MAGKADEPPWLTSFPAITVCEKYTIVLVKSLIQGDIPIVSQVEIGARCPLGIRG